MQNDKYKTYSIIKMIVVLLTIFITLNSCDNVVQTNYYLNGFKKSEGRTYKNHKTGEWNYWDETGNLTKTEFYNRNGDMELLRGFYENGKMKFSKYFYKKEPIKEWIFWNKKGQVIKKEYYENGKLIKIY